MSTLVAQTLSNGTVSTSTANCIQGSAKAWVNFDGTGTVAIRASYNVSSITDNGTGDYTVNFTTAMPDANYSCLITVGDFALGGGLIGAQTSSAATRTSSAVRFNCQSAAGTAFDMNQLSVSVFR